MAFSGATSAAVGDTDVAAMEVDKLYDFGERLAAASDKSQCVGDYMGIIDGVKKGNLKAKQLAAQLIPRFFKFFPALQQLAIDSQVDLLEEDDLAVRIQAIRGLAVIGKETPDCVPKIMDIIVQLLNDGDNVERDAVHKAMMSLIRQDTKASLAALFKNVETSSETVRDKIISFIKDKVFPHKAELLKPQQEMERYITDLIKKSLQDVTGAEFKFFMDFLNSLLIFGDGAPAERIQELIEIIEAQADLDAQFDVEDVDHIDRFISCMYMALPFFMRGASCSRFLNYLNKHILPVFDKFPEERKLDLLKNLAVSSTHATAQDARLLLPSLVQLLQKYVPRRKTEDVNINFIECLLYAFHHLAHKTPNSTNSLCGYKIVTGQPSDRLGEDFSEIYKDFTARLSTTEEVVKVTMKKLTQALGDHNKALSGAKTDEEKTNIKKEQHKVTAGLRMCNNILAMTQPLHAKAPSFIGDNKINLSWKETSSKTSASTTTQRKRNGGPTQGSNIKSTGNKKLRGEGPGPNQFVNRALEGVQARGGRNQHGGRGFGGRRRGRGGGFHQFR